MSVINQARFRWSYHDPLSGASTQVIAGRTRSEARGAVKKALGLKRIPCGVFLTRLRILFANEMRSEQQVTT